MKVPGTRLRVSLNNRLRTYDYQVWFAVVPVSGDPSDAPPPIPLIRFQPVRWREGYT